MPYDNQSYYQWQQSEDGGVTWTNIDGAYGYNFTLSDDQIGAQVRVQ
ncbi:MAG: hypothetical protein F6K36_30075, partial [Symploca sp. SIO3C6]|nr:hypothetical protein [Symploca sp. SIO3C6]